MRSTQKIVTLKDLSIVPFLFACIPIAFIYMFLREIPILSSLFIEYVNEGASVFFPFLTSTIIVFQFTTGHLIDIIIVFNIVSFLERGGYHYYMKVCLQKNYLEFYSDASFLDNSETQDDLLLNLDLLLGRKVDLDTIMNVDSYGIKFDDVSRINANYFSNKSGYHIAKKHNFLDYVRNSRKNIIQLDNFYSFFQTFLTSNFRACNLPSRINCNFSTSYLYNQLEEGL